MPAVCCGDVMVDAERGGEVNKNYPICPATHTPHTPPMPCPQTQRDGMFPELHLPDCVNMMLYKQENMVSVIHEDKYKPSIDGTFLPIKTQ